MAWRVVWFSAVLVALAPVGVVRAQSSVVDAGRSVDDPPVAIIDDPGPGWTEVVDEGAGDGPVTTRAFQHASGRLDLTALPPPPASMDVASFIRRSVLVPSGVQEITVPIADAVAFGGSGADQQLHLLAFPDRAGLFVFQLTSAVDAPWDPIDLLVGLARRQIEQDGAATPSTASPVPESLLPYLAADPPPGHPGLVPVDLIGGPETVGEEIGGRADVVEYLNEHTVSAVRLWRDPTSDVAYGVSVTEFPFPQFAEVAASAYLGNGYRRTTDAVLAGEPDVVSFRGTGARDDLAGVAFRRGDLFVVVLGRGSDASTVDELVAAAARQHLAIAPDGATEQSSLPSPSESLLRSSTLVGGAGLGLLGIRRARVARQVARRPVVDPGASTTVVDVGAAASRSRRGALLLALVQVVAWVVTIVGIAADVPLWVRCLLVVVGAGGGMAVTTWWRRVDLARAGEVPRRQLGRQPRWSGVALLAGGAAVLIAGIAAVVWGLRELVFLPSLTHLRLADRTGVEPHRLALLISLGGVATALAGTAVLRRGRSRARAGASAVRRADPRPPVLYLRSFEDDAIGLPSVLSTRRPFTELFTLRTADPFEEGIAWELATYGPVTAVGRPGRPLDSLGAAREHLSNDTWQREVAERMAEARAIVIVPGTTSGLQWEIAEVVSGGHLDRTVFVMPPVSTGELEERWRIACQPLPEPLGSSAQALRLDSVLTVQLGDERPRVTVGRHRDEADYRAAMDAAMAVGAASPA